MYLYKCKAKQYLIIELAKTELILIPNTAPKLKIYLIIESALIIINNNYKDGALSGSEL